MDPNEPEAQVINPFPNTAAIVLDILEEWSNAEGNEAESFQYAQLNQAMINSIINPNAQIPIPENSHGPHQHTTHISHGVDFFALEGGEWMRPLMVVNLTSLTLSNLTLALSPDKYAPSLNLQMRNFFRMISHRTDAATPGRK